MFNGYDFFECDGFGYIGDLKFDEKEFDDSGLAVCPVCKKKFVPAPMHVYKIGENERPVCSWGCLVKYRKDKEKKKIKKINNVYRDLYKMKCPMCGGITTIRDSQCFPYEKYVLKRRKCFNCGFTFKAIESSDEVFDKLTGKGE